MYGSMSLPSTVSKHLDWIIIAVLTQKPVDICLWIEICPQTLMAKCRNMGYMVFPRFILSLLMTEWSSHWLQFEVYEFRWNTVVILAILCCKACLVGGGIRQNVADKCMSASVQVMFFQCHARTNISMAKCETAICPFLMNWRCCSPALNHRYGVTLDLVTAIFVCKSG